MAEVIKEDVTYLNDPESVAEYFTSLAKATVGLLGGAMFLVYIASQTNGHYKTGDLQLRTNGGEPITIPDGCEISNWDTSGKTFRIPNDVIAGEDIEILVTDGMYQNGQMTGVCVEQ